MNTNDITVTNGLTRIANTIDPQGAQWAQYCGRFADTLDLFCRAAAAGGAVHPQALALATRGSCEPSELHARVEQAWALVHRDGFEARVQPFGAGLLYESCSGSRVILEPDSDSTEGHWLVTVSCADDRTFPAYRVAAAGGSGWVFSAAELELATAASGAGFAHVDDEDGGFGLLLGEQRVASVTEYGSAEQPPLGSNQQGRHFGALVLVGPRAGELLRLFPADDPETWARTVLAAVA